MDTFAILCHLYPKSLVLGNVTNCENSKIRLQEHSKFNNVSQERDTDLDVGNCTEPGSYICAQYYPET